MTTNETPHALNDVYKGGTLTDHDALDEPTEIMEIVRRGDWTVVKGKDFEWGGVSKYLGLRASPKGGMEISGPGGMGCTITRKADAEVQRELAGQS